MTLAASPTRPNRMATFNQPVRSEGKFAALMSSKHSRPPARTQLVLSGAPPSMPVTETAMVENRSQAAPATTQSGTKKPLTGKAAKIAAAKAKKLDRLAKKKAIREEAKALVKAKALAIKEKKVAAIAEKKARVARAKEHKTAKLALLKAKKLVKPREAKHRKLGLVAKQVAGTSGKKIVIAQKMIAAAQQLRDKSNQDAEASRDSLSKAVAAVAEADAKCKATEPPKRTMKTVIKTITKKPAGGRK